jgi:predicted nucleotidyltransferase
MIKFLKKDMQKFKEMEILAIYLFGSMATGKNVHDRSDFDFGIFFENMQQLKNDELEVYGKLYDIIIEKLTKKYLKKRFELGAHEVDIVFLQNAPISFQAQVAQEGKVLYESDKNKRANYKEYVLARYCDLQYVYAIAHNYLLERI